MRRPLIVLVAGLAAFHLVVAASNTADVIGGALGWSDGAWRSGNVAWVQKAVEQGHLHLGDARTWGYVTTTGAGILQLLAGILLVVAVVTLLRAPVAAQATRRWVRWGASCALVVWLGLTVGDELFLAYETSGWDLFVLMALLVSATWIAAEVLPFGDDAGAGPQSSSAGTP